MIAVGWGVHLLARVTAHEASSAGYQVTIATVRRLEFHKRNWIYVWNAYKSVESKQIILPTTCPSLGLQEMAADVEDRTSIAIQAEKLLVIMPSLYLSALVQVIAGATLPCTLF